MTHTRPRYTRQRLEATAARSKSLVEMLRQLEQPLAPGPLRYLRKRLVHYGVDTSHFVEEKLPERPRQRYERQALGEAVRLSHSLREVVDRLDVIPYDGIYGYLARRLARFGIDTSHFGTTKISEGELRSAVADSVSIAGVLRALGLAESTTARRRVKAGIESYGLSTAHFTGQGHYRNRPAHNRKKAAHILCRLPAGSSRTNRSLLHRALQERAVPYRCAECGTGERWRGKRLVLEIDHLNGDRLDNRLSNLRYLCPSCHSQTLTYSRPRRSPAALPHQKQGDAQ